MATLDEIFNALDFDGDHWTIHGKIDSPNDAIELIEKHSDSDAYVFLEKICTKLGVNDTNLRTRYYSHYYPHATKSHFQKFLSTVCDRELSGHQHFCIGVNLRNCVANTSSRNVVAFPKIEKRELLFSGADWYRLLSDRAKTEFSLYSRLGEWLNRYPERALAQIRKMPIFNCPVISYWGNFSYFFGARNFDEWRIWVESSKSTNPIFVCFRDDGFFYYSISNRGKLSHGKYAV